MLKYIVMFKKFSDNLYYYLIASISVLYMEMLLALRSGFDMSGYMTLGVVFCAFSFGALILLLSTIFGNSKTNGWIFFVLIELITLFFLIEFFCNQTYNTFMNVNAVTNGAGNVVTEYWGIVMSVIKNGLLTIFLYHIPSIAILVFCIRKQFRPQRNLMTSISMVVFAAVLFFSSESAMTLKPFAAEKYTYNYMYNDAVHAFGLTHGTWLDIKYGIAGVPDPPLDTRDNTQNNTDDDMERNELNFAWNQITAATEDSTIQNLFNIVKNQKGSNKNEYTGLFEGKNLVILAVESMSKEMITEQFFPLMYRMMTKGIVFEDYYVPSWGGSTSTGETAILTGLIPMYNLDTIQMTIGSDNSYTMASMLTDQRNYFTAAYHNGAPGYYNRSVTHPSLGFSKFDANDSAMANYLNYMVPPSDLEMLQYIGDDIKGKDPFYIYAMTYSGHGNYSFEWGANQMGWKNHELLAGTPLYDDDILGGYISCSMELELGLEEFVKVLEQRGELDDTVFVLSSDHYPYFLQEPLAWGGEDYTKYLYGYQYSNCFERDHSALIIWSPCLEEMDPIVVSEPTSQIDILPTLLNLFGLDFDSRIFAGRDVLSDSLGIAIWADSSWKTPEGYYLASKGEFKLYENSSVTDADAYFDQMQSLVRNKIYLSRNFITEDFYKYLSPYIIDEDSNIAIELSDIANEEQLKEVVQTVALKMTKVKQ